MFQIIQVTPSQTKNPFYTLVPNYLAQRGYSLEYSTDFDLIAERVKESRVPTVVVLHQLEPLYHSASGDLNETHEKARILLERCSQLKKIGARLLHYAHNPWPHNRRFVEVDAELYRKFFPLTDGVVVLCRYALKEIEKNYRPKRLFLQNRPSFYPQYGESVCRNEARAKLKMDNNAIYLGHLGRTTHYKNIPFLIAAVRELRKTVSSDLR